MPERLLPFNEFIASVEASKFGDFSSRPQSNVADGEAFAEMKSYILDVYDKIDVQHSFEDEGGSIFDCVPVEQQPALRGSDGQIPKAPDLPQPKTGEGPEDARKPDLVSSPFGPDRKDRYGNVMDCPENAIPMRRITLEDITRFESLQRFFKKGPLTAGPPVVHHWARAYQDVNNLGGHSFLNVWDPSIGANQSRVFSLSQHWFTAGSNAGLQTVECGWHVFPQIYGGDTKPRLFVYWTADNYVNTGSYNLAPIIPSGTTKISAFVQTSNVFAPGMILSPWSLVGGKQTEIQLAFMRAAGKWWLYFNGTAASNAIGYYPDSIFNKGPLTSGATAIKFGGEVCSDSGVFPPMGSGAKPIANGGYGTVAYQRGISYYTAKGAVTDVNLTNHQDSPNCYQVQVDYNVAPWLGTVWFGGLGGKC